MTDRLLPYYNQELQFLRRFGSEFAKQHPKIAARLRLGDELSEDPHVSRIIESFALLSARTRLKLDDDFPEITQALLGVLYPHYLAPIPSTAVVQFDLDPRQADLVGGYEIEAGSAIETESTEDGVCQYRTVYPVKLFPIRVSAATYKGQPFQSPPSPLLGKAESVLHLELNTFRESVTFEMTEIDSLRFFIRGISHAAMDLFELVHNDSIEILIAKSERDPNPIRLSKDNLRMIGFDTDQCIFPQEARTFNGYRLLTEYFAAPEKFMFFDVAGIRKEMLSGFGNTMHLFVLIKRHVSSVEQFVDSETVRLGCAPIVNLFEHRCEPIRVGHATHEYRVVPDARQPRAFEVHSIESVKAIDSDRPERDFHPFYSIRHAGEQRDRRGFYHTHRRRSDFSGGTQDSASEVYLSLVDLDFNPDESDGTVLDIRALCSSRNLPQRLEFGGGRPAMSLVNGGPLLPPKCVTQPRVPLRPPLEKGTYWRLISHLSLGHISLFDQREGASAIREILGLYEYIGKGDAQQRIDSIRSVVCSPSVARCKAPTGGLAMCRGLDLELTIDEEKLSSGGAYLLGCVLERFFGLYASINSFTRTTLRSSLREQEIARWPARSGRQEFL
ncbi:type VI secretion system baseplate subunit TssF [Rhodopirellula sp. MGV]|uniref:type VI secretion system baseplate subunit TssF n=1 Tax=Rhodopirellula sp. MGV TaxID=2023130 RepID=UPI000B97C62A|nr:type VI secretion system baseplate subunit TssF [Rhodopirellula sp. MGV]OYP35478.1 type VI secretion system ImpG/VasA family protein [Rhodopirellula sp. MGV]PNY33920.1 type VI secretion system baseplate subunit TssF [Rhodopirellula baltica]